MLDGPAINISVRDITSTLAGAEALTRYGINAQRVQGRRIRHKGPQIGPNFTARKEHQTKVIGVVQRMMQENRRRDGQPVLRPGPRGQALLAVIEHSPKDAGTQEPQDSGLAVKMGVNRRGRSAFGMGQPVEGDCGKPLIPREFSRFGRVPDPDRLAFRRACGGRWLGGVTAVPHSLRSRLQQDCVRQGTSSLERVLMKSAADCGPRSKTTPKGLRLWNVVLTAVGVAIAQQGLNIGLGGSRTLWGQGAGDFIAVRDDLAPVSQDCQIRFLGGIWSGVRALFLLGSCGLGRLRPTLILLCGTIALAGRFPRQRIGCPRGRNHPLSGVGTLGFPALALWLARMV
jgi:hypothetical protein